MMKMWRMFVCVCVYVNVYQAEQSSVIQQHEMKLLNANFEIFLISRHRIQLLQSIEDDSRHD